MKALPSVGSIPDCSISRATLQGLRTLLLAEDIYTRWWRLGGSEVGDRGVANAGVVPSLRPVLICTTASGFSLLNSASNSGAFRSDHGIHWSSDSGYPFQWTRYCT